MSNTGALAINTDIHRGMTSREIKAELILRGISIKDIADQAGVTGSAITQIINQCPSTRYKGYRLRIYIAKALERKEEDIWPK
jgi:lambda repressor-like predicted transcriptional regulator